LCPAGGVNERVKIRNCGWAGQHVRQAISDFWLVVPFLVTFLGMQKGKKKNISFLDLVNHKMIYHDQWFIVQRENPVYM
jgi:hypothetical protein